ncbi:hypothetical protein PSPO01_02955 [Paraphaeosphaeria sporulosa]
MSAHSHQERTAKNGTECGEAWISRERHYFSLAGPEAAAIETTGALQAGNPLIETSGTMFWRAKETQGFFHRQMYFSLLFR